MAEDVLIQTNGLPLRDKDIRYGLRMNILAGALGMFYVAVALGMPMTMLLEALNANGFMIGLLGTVVGIINAFEGLGFEKTASIQAVAPGISEALIATAAGLFAAIPAVIAYNHFISNIKDIAADLDDFSSEFLNLVERSFS